MGPGSKTPRRAPKGVARGGRAARPAAARSGASRSGASRSGASRSGASRKAAGRRGAVDVAALVAGLEALYPEAHCELDFAGPFQLLVATILSAQSTDKMVNSVTPALFARFP